MFIQNCKKLFLAFGVTFLTALIGSLLTSSAVTTWYQTINRPSFTPPNWLFGPAWTTLFILMALAWFLILKTGPTNKYYKTANYIFIIQLLLNAFWSFLFFYLQNPFLAMLEIIVFWLVLVLNFTYFYRINKKAAWLFVPYIAWVSFAAFLTYSIWRLN